LDMFGDCKIITRGETWRGVAALPARCIFAALGVILGVNVAAPSESSMPASDG
jgi:hypothetical protein